jgi:monovalent cation:H+ antiporter-2, CPA2 family
MHQEITLIATIAMAVLTAFIGGYIARRLGLPSLVGYLLAGLVIGPFTPGFVGDAEAAAQLAEMGVIFMMFGVGLHFSLKDLWSVRRIAIPGAVLQMTFATLLGLGLSQLWGWSISAGLVLGLAISIASTVVLLRGLSDNGLLNTAHGKVAVGWLVLEDLATVAILVLLPALVSDVGNPIESIGLAILKTGIFVALMLFIGVRVMPWILTRIAHTRSAELFILAVVALALGTAFAAYELFGVSLALGAFLAGVVVGESDISHQTSAQVLPFRDLFAVLFFVSVGMLVNPAVVLANAGQVVALTTLIVVGKALITLLLGFVLPASARTLLVVAVGLSQIGEFSFIVGQAGVSLGLLTQDQYGLILAGALLSIVINPLMFRVLPSLERVLQRNPSLWRRLERGGPTPVALHQGMTDHVVVVGYGRVGKHIGQVLRQLGLPYLVVEQDVAYVTEIQKEGIPTLFGDAANSEVLTHTGLEAARALVVTVPSETTAELIVAAAHGIAPNLSIIARAGTPSGVKRLSTLGAHHVIHPELEGGLEIVRHMLLTLDYPMEQIQPYIDAVRRDAYEGTLLNGKQYPVLDQLLTAVRGVNIAWHMLEEDSPIIGKSLEEANIRSKVGASVIALIRDDQVTPNPKSDTKFQQGDLLGLIGDTEELTAARQLLNPVQQLT